MHCTIHYFKVFCKGGLIMVFLDRNMQSFLQENRVSFRRNYNHLFKKRKQDTNHIYLLIRSIVGNIV